MVSLALETAFLGAISADHRPDSAHALRRRFAIRLSRLYGHGRAGFRGSAVPAGTLGLPSSLVIAPGRYAFRGKTYDLQKQGLYRFIYPNKENQQRIVYDTNGGNVEALLSGLAWCVSHGNSDDSKSSRGVDAKGHDGRSCSSHAADISQWALHDLAVATTSEHVRPIRSHSTRGTVTTMGTA